MEAAQSYRGAGLIVDAELGLVVTDRLTVVSHMGEANIIFDSSLILAAKVVYLHPVHNFAVIQYDPKLLGENKHAVGSAKLSSEEPKVGASSWFIGLNSSTNSRRHAQLISRQTRICQPQWMHLGTPQPPRFSQFNLEFVHLEDAVGTAEVIP
jgi:hypothetical protein